MRVDISSVDKSIYIYDGTYPNYGHFIKVSKILYDGDTKFQHITVADADNLGRILFLDYDFNVSTMMEAFYHEPMAHIPIGIVHNPKRVLVIGGGDFGLASHVLKHKNLESVDMCELDEGVANVSREFFPWANICEKDERFTLYIGDGFDFLKNKEDGYYDVIIVDSTDPFAKASILISDEFFDNVKRTLKDGGALMQIISDALFYGETWNDVMPKLTKRFSSVNPLFVPIPFYATGSWGLCLSLKGIDKLPIDKITDNYLSSIDSLKTMTADLVRGWFSLPSYIKELIYGK